jgi:hypothetical protein
MGLILAGCDFRSGSEVDRDRKPGPPSPPPAYLKMPLEVTIPDVPKVPEAIREPSPPIKEDQAEPSSDKPATKPKAEKPDGS